MRFKHYPREWPFPNVDGNAKLAIALTDTVRLYIDQASPDLREDLLLSIVKEWDSLMDLPPGPSRARIVYSRIDSAISHAKHKKPDFKRVACKANCSACCHYHVTVTDDEARLLAQKIVNREVDVDMHHLTRQAEAGKTVDDYGKLNWDERACVFLGRDGNCQVYNDRPSTCRKWFVPGPPESCADWNFYGEIIYDLKTEIIASAAMNLPPINEVERLSIVVLGHLNKVGG